MPAEACSCAPETFVGLLTNLAHWEFELFLMLVVDMLAIGVGWRYFHKWLHRHFRGETP
jgi:hypothetical protein